MEINDEESTSLKPKGSLVLFFWPNKWSCSEIWKLLIGFQAHIKAFRLKYGGKGKSDIWHKEHFKKPGKIISYTPRKFCQKKRN